ncbi:hypothetical protein K2173_000425 [Erythroxylum novogranatense]|uniref:Pentatricopeptide repeat-containing protein n=1 Tax=Erythroxylum novogranatense TaxID=1862640 RepID=A0AAV8SX58_9ROSI|nr:hypothetical protein K2173_000425 [Erythroxylum novogranatense]
MRRQQCANTHLYKLLLSLKQSAHSSKHIDQILTHTITTGLAHATRTWNCLIRAYSKSPTPIKAVLIYNHFITFGSDFPDNYTYPVLFKACSRIYWGSTGKQLHAHVVKIGLQSDICVQNALIHFYGAVSLLTDACKLFDEMPVRDVATWNSVMCAYSTNTRSPRKVVVLLKKMINDYIRPDQITWVIILSACTQLDESGCGRAIHSYVLKLGLACVLNVSNALLGLYIKCKKTNEALRLFSELDLCRDLVSCTILINGYVEMGSLDMARDIFDQIVDKDIVLWNLLVHAYAKAKRPLDALDLFMRMENEQVIPDESTMVSVLAACASLTDLHSGRLAHQFINYHNIRQDIVLKTALIDMYFKCGSMEEALVTFYKMEEKDAFSWTAVIEGLGNLGYGNEALSLFYQMEGQGAWPNAATFVSVLKACSHSGLINEGCQLFKRMVEAYQVQPRIEHFGCLIDLLSRTGLLHEVEEFVKLLLPEERLVAYKTLLNACIKYSEFKLGDKIGDEIMKLSCDTYETHILLSNFRALAGQWTQVAKTRRIMEDFCIRRKPGTSSLALET